MKKLFCFIFTALLLLGFTGQASGYGDAERIFGDSRYHTAVEISKKGWKGGAGTVVLARGDSYPDALAGVPLARKSDAPILLTATESLHPVAKEEIKRLKPDTILILGGENAISLNVEKEVKAMGIKVDRIFGKDRYSTSVEIAKKLGGTKEKAVVVTGRDFPDALSIAPFAAEKEYPILLTAPKDLPSEVRTHANSYNSTLVIGGAAAVSDEVMGLLPDPERIFGKTRYETAGKIIEENYESNRKLYISTGENFADALTGSVLASKNGTATMLVSQAQIPSGAEELFATQQVKSLRILGGEAAVPASIVSKLTDIISGLPFETIGAAKISDDIQVVDDSEAEIIEANLDAAEGADNGTVTLKLPPEKTKGMQEDSFLFLEPSDEYPTGFIGKITDIDQDGAIKLEQPKFDEVFDKIKIHSDEILSSNTLIDIQLEEGVEASAGDSGPIDSQSLHQQKMKEEFMLLANEGKNEIRFTIDKTLWKLRDEGEDGKKTNSHVKLAGSLKLDNMKSDVDIEKTKGLKFPKQFDFNFDVDHEENLKFLIQGEGNILKQKNKKGSLEAGWLSMEGVDRSDRISLATLTYQIGTVPVYGLGDKGYIPIPAGATVFITTNFKGEIKLEFELGVQYEASTKVKASLGLDEVDASFSQEEKKAEVYMKGSGEASMSTGFGVEPALNIGGILPLVVQNDMKVDTSIKGYADLTYDLINKKMESSGCFETGFSAGLESNLKARMAFKVKGLVDHDQYYKYQLYNLPLYKKDNSYCTETAVSGKVTDAESGEEIEGVKVKVSSQSNPEEFVTDSKGEYGFTLKSGIYDLEFSKAGYKPVIMKDYTIKGSKMDIPVEMEPAFESYFPSSPRVAIFDRDEDSSDFDVIDYKRIENGNIYIWFIWNDFNHPFAADYFEDETGLYQVSNVNNEKHLMVEYPAKVGAVQNIEYLNDDYGEIETINKKIEVLEVSSETITYRISAPGGSGYNYTIQKGKGIVDSDMVELTFPLTSDQAQTIIRIAKGKEDTFYLPEHDTDDYYCIEITYSYGKSYFKVYKDSGKFEHLYL